MYISFFVLIVILLVVFFIGSWAGTKYGYVPKHHIELIWKGIHKLCAKIGKARQDGNEEFALYLEGAYNSEIKKRGELINILLSHHFDPQNEEDREYIRLHRYSGELHKKM